MTDPEQLELDPDPRPWFAVQYDYGGGSNAANAYVRANDREEAKKRADEMLRDIGVLPGPMHESWKRFAKATSDGVRSRKPANR